MLQLILYVTLLGSKPALEKLEIRFFFIEVSNTRPYEEYVANFLGRLHRGMYLKHARLVKDYDILLFETL